MTDTPYHDLAARIEAADGPDRAQFCAAYQLVFPPPAEPYGEYADKMDGFCVLLDAGGWTSAAEMLVPEGWTDVRQHHHLMTDGTTRAYAEVEFVIADMTLTAEGSAPTPTPAQALAAACLRARSS